MDNSNINFLTNGTNLRQLNGIHSIKKVHYINYQDMIFSIIAIAMIGLVLYSSFIIYTNKYSEYISRTESLEIHREQELLQHEQQNSEELQELLTQHLKCIHLNCDNINNDK